MISEFSALYHYSCVISQSPYLGITFQEIACVLRAYLEFLFQHKYTYSGKLNALSYLPSKLRKYI